MIKIFGTTVYINWWYLQAFFSFFEIFIFWAIGGKRAKNSPKWKIRITSVTRLISGTIKHRIKIFGTLVLNYDISRCFFILLKFWFFGAVRGVKGQKNSPKWKTTITSVMHHISEAYYHGFWYTCVKWWYLQAFFSLFWNFKFLGC